MSIIAKIINIVGAGRLKEIDEFRRNPFCVQQQQFKKLMVELSATVYGSGLGIRENSSYDEFAAKVPVVEYNDLDPFIERMRMGEQNLLVAHEVEWYAKSSGTTATKSKFIPVPSIHLDKCHYQGTKDVIFILSENYPDLNMFNGKTLTLGGSHTLDEMSESGARYGDLSAILIQNAPFYTSTVRLPEKSIALTANFDKKIEEICRTCTVENVTAIAGVPSWNLVMLNRVLDYTGKNTICDVWENMEVFMHGGVHFAPYKTEFQRIIPSSKMKYIETYNASEGFFSIQDEPSKDDMLLMLDYGLFYEFLPVKDLNDYSKVVPLEGVKTGVNYCMIISSFGGLWRYLIGDTVTFTSLVPHKIKITGRTKLFINAFGEEVIIDNADKALAEACRVTGAIVHEYTAGPVFMEEGAKGSHQWLIEFREQPSDMSRFCDVLDHTLQSVNSDYEAKRSNNATLLPPKIEVLPTGTFFNWMAKRGKTGGQNKVPRLSNDRKYIDELLNLKNA